jgi:hypothetical protein
MLFRVIYSPRRRLGASIILSFLSLSSIYFFLGDRTGLGIKLQKIGEVTGLEGYGGIWNWDEDSGEGNGGKDGGEGVKIVVFGDSWVDDKVRSGESGEGKSWARVLCEEVRQYF